MVGNREESRGLLDTSVLIAIESGRSLRAEAIPETAAISVVTKAELRVGIFAAEDIETRDRRLMTWELANRIVSLPIDEAVSRAWAQMRAYLRASQRRVKINDIWIAATAAAYDIPVLTQDADFDALNGVAGLTVIPV
ncbi:MAG TPA: type II toxin-antitoxin system VapC family toxin [Solirubrobacterales bacterium]|nr:type II toxin-antitoxin system VapC family toxin [Solirubrobacterales bacterium]